MTIPVQIVINAKTQMINNRIPLYRRTICFNSLKIICWHWFIVIFVLFFIWNNAKFVLSLLKGYFVGYTRYILCNSHLAWFIAPFKFDPLDNKDVSLANNLTALHPVALYISLVYNKNNDGPRTDPISTPKFTMPYYTPLATLNWRI